MLLLSDRLAEIIFYGACSHFVKQMQYCPSLCPVFSLFILLMVYLTETFATEAKNSSLHAGNLFILGPLLQTHTRSWKHNKKPLYLQRHRVKHSEFTSNLFEMQIVLQIGPPSSFTRPPINLFSLLFFSSLLLLKIPNYNFRPNQSSLTWALQHQVVTFIIRYSALLLLPSEALPGNRSFSVPIQIFYPPWDLT